MTSQPRKSEEAARKAGLSGRQPSQQNNTPAGAQAVEEPDSQRWLQHGRCSLTASSKKWCFSLTGIRSRTDRHHEACTRFKIRRDCLACAFQHIGVNVLMCWWVCEAPSETAATSVLCTRGVLGCLSPAHLRWMTATEAGRHCAQRRFHK